MILIARIVKSENPHYVYLIESYQTAQRFPMDYESTMIPEPPIVCYVDILVSQ
jgi:hypothetical protein